MGWLYREIKYRILPSLLTRTKNNVPESCITATIQKLLTRGKRQAKQKSTKFLTHHTVNLRRAY